MLRSILLIYLLASSNSTLSSLLAKQAELTTKHDYLLDQLAIITDENENYSPSKSPLHRLFVRLENIKDESSTYSTYMSELNDMIADLKLSQTRFFYSILKFKIKSKYSFIREIKDNLIQASSPLTTLLKNFEECKQINETQKNSFKEAFKIHRRAIEDLSYKTKILFKDEITNSKDLINAQTRISQFSGIDVLANMMLLEDAYSDEIVALSKSNRILEQIKKNNVKEKESCINYETKFWQFESESSFCFKSFLELAKYFGYSYSAIYFEEAIQYFDKFRKTVRFLLDSVNKFFLGQHDANLKRNIHNLKLHFEEIEKKFKQDTSIPISFENHSIYHEFRLPKTVTFKDESKIKNTIFDLIEDRVSYARSSSNFYFYSHKVTKSLDLFLKVIEQNEKIKEFWVQIDLIKEQIEQLTDEEKRTIYKNEENLKKFSKLKFETKYIREELKKVNEEILFKI